MMRMLPWMMVFSPVTAERRMMKMPPRDSVDCFSLNSLVPGARAGTKSPTLSFHHGQLVVFFFFFLDHNIIGENARRASYNGMYP